MLLSIFLKDEAKHVFRSLKITLQLYFLNTDTGHLEEDIALFQ